MTELERALEGLARELDLPRTPPLAAAVAQRLREEVPAAAAIRRRRRVPRLLPRLVLAALVALLLLAGAAVAFPGARHAVLDFLGLRGATVERSKRRPPGPLRSEPVLGRRVGSLAAARGRLAFEPLAPSVAGRPPRVYVSRRAVGGALSLAYRPRRGLPAPANGRIGLLVTEFRGDLDPAFANKVAGQGTHVERLRLAGERAIWLEGASHFFFYRRPDGGFAEDTLRLAHNVLLLERSRLLIRLEGAMTRERAIAIARSLRPG